MRLELNLPALERLIGGDTELELHLRHQIVEEFTKKHLKEIAKSDMQHEAIAAIKKHVNETAKELFDVGNLATTTVWPNVSVRLKQMIETVVNEHAQKSVNKSIETIIEYQKRYWDEEIRKAVGKAIDREIEKEVQEGIKRRLSAALNSSLPVN